MFSISLLIFYKLNAEKSKMKFIQVHALSFTHLIKMVEKYLRVWKIREGIMGCTVPKIPTF